MVKSITVRVSNILFVGRGMLFVGARVGNSDPFTEKTVTVWVTQATLGKTTVVLGDTLILDGAFEHYRGTKQFRSTKISTVRPEGKNLVSFLAGKRFPGVGPVKARALLRQFGSQLTDILDKGDVSSLSEVVTVELASIVVKGWQSFHLGDLLAWLDEYHFPAALGQRIVEFYGPSAVEKIAVDPYRLLAFGERWAQIDEIALQRLGVRRDDPQREHAAVAQCLYEAWDREGSTALGWAELLQRVRTRLGGTEIQAKRAINRSYQDGAWLRLGSGLFQTSGAYLMEQYIATRIRRMIASDESVSPFNPGHARPGERDPKHYESIRRALGAWQAEHYELGPEQNEAVWLALTNQFSVISGGAGVGKTTVLRALHAGLAALGEEVEQMALSGRAVQRMREATAQPATTIAAFLGGRDRFDTGVNSTKRHLGEDKAYVVDEASMLDVPTLYKLLRYVGPRARLILVGDDMQLPPIGPGLTFHLLCQETAVAPRAHLTQVYRQKTNTGIPATAQAFRQGEWAEMDTYKGPAAGVSVLPCNVEDAGDIIADTYSALVSAEGNEQEVQILCATKGNRRDTPISVSGINKDLYRRRLNGRSPVMLSTGWSGFCEGCPIVFVENDWERNIFNGSLGVISEAFSRLKDDGVVCRVLIEGRELDFTEADLQRVQRAYALTVHKAQGSQWNRVIVPIASSSILDRTLIYTAITRGVHQVVLIGDINAAKLAVQNRPRAFARVNNLHSLLNSARPMVARFDPSAPQV
jgi:exodeoxyribonuclease V alpha subunit